MKTVTAKFVGFLTFIVLGANAYAAGIPEGRYAGRGQWKSPQKEGTYKVETVIGRDTIATSYSMPDGSKRTANFRLTALENGNFKIKSHGQLIGHGYCLDRAEVCHFEIKMSGLELEETLTSMNGKLYRFGSKNQGQGLIT